MKEELKNRTIKLAVKCYFLSCQIPSTSENRVIKTQWIKCATSIAANYRAALRARSRKEYFSKICIVVEEADENAFWIEFIKEVNLLEYSQLDPVESESMELLKIFSTIKSRLRT